PVLVSQRRRVRSKPQEASIDPSGEKHNARTRPTWPLGVQTREGGSVVTSVMRMSWEPVASKRESGLKAMAPTKLSCTLKVLTMASDFVSSNATSPDDLQTATSRPSGEKHNGSSALAAELTLVEEAREVPDFVSKI